MGYADEAYLYVREAEGTKITITRVWKTNDNPSEDYLGELVDGTEVYLDGEYWVRYDIWQLDGFIIDVETLPEYTLKTYTVSGRTVSFNTFGNLYYLDEVGYEYWRFSDFLSDTSNKDLFIYTSTTYGGDNSDGNGQGWINGDSYNANDPPYIGEKSPDGLCYILVKQAEGTKLTVNRVYTEAGDYIGELVNGELFEDEYGTWRKYRAWNDDYFTIEAEALPGYTIDRHDVDGFTHNFYASGIRFENYYDLTGGWNFDPGDYGEVARIYTTATNIGGSGKDYGSGSGTLYFDVSECRSQFAVEFAYSDNKFYVTSVKIKKPLESDSSWTFNLLVKINDVVICSGVKDYGIKTLDWYDLGISGCAGITDEVKITLLGFASTGPSSNDKKFVVASPAIQTIIILKNGVFIESEYGFDEYTPYIYTEVISGQTYTAEYMPYSIYIDNGTSWEKL